MATYRKRGLRWQAIVRKKGAPPQVKTFRTKAQAQVWARELEDLIERGEFGGKQVAAGTTLVELLEHQLESQHRRQMAKAASGSNQTYFNNLTEFFGADYTVADLCLQDLTGFCRKRMDEDGVKPATILLDIMFLSAALHTAFVDLGLDQKHYDLMQLWIRALFKQGYIGKSKERDRRVTPAELDKLLAYFKYNAALKADYVSLVRFAVESAMRLGEICRLRWDDYDREKGTIIVRDRKLPTGRLGNHQKVPLLGECQKIIDAQPKTGPLIFPYKVDTVGAGFRRACNLLEIEDLRFHDLRHEGISRLFEKGYAIQEVALVSGHRDWKSLKRYVNLRPEDLVQKDRG